MGRDGTEWDGTGRDGSGRGGTSDPVDMRQQKRLKCEQRYIACAEQENATNSSVCICNSIERTRRDAQAEPKFHSLAISTLPVHYLRAEFIVADDLPSQIRNGRVAVAVVFKPVATEQDIWLSSACLNRCLKCYRGSATHVRKVVAFGTIYDLRFTIYERLTTDWMGLPVAYLIRFDGIVNATFCSIF
ncbi:hypothetical protein V9T40_007440 [Parthenolecanium corni]|uniref:Uncharacterized protein n=1 Tax=Parthenolecanium corni TaxID=536013 RepID=A0AAN9YBS4_9HEMI